MPGSGSEQFDKLKAHLDRDPMVRREVEFAFSALLTKANPTDRAARFVFGGGAEWIVAAAAWSAGVLTAPAGHNANGFDLSDLLDRSRALWSVKASASKGSSQIRLINFLGDGMNAVWVEPTLFVGPYYGGAVLIDPRQEPGLRAMARRGSDALVLAGGIPKQYAASHPQNRISFDVAVNEGSDSSGDFSFIKSLLDPVHFPNLSKPFLAAAPIVDTNRVEEIKKLADLRDKGVLSEDQFKKAVDTVIS